MTDARRILIHALAILLAAAALPQAAWACTDGSATRFYFQRQPPVMTPDIMFVQVTIVSKTMTSVEARLEAPYASLSADGMIHIVLPLQPQGANCIEWGELKGPVYVVASSALVRDGRASIMANPLRLPQWRDHRGREHLDRLRRDAKIWIDPSYLAPGKP